MIKFNIKKNLLKINLYYILLKNLINFRNKFYLK